MEASRPNPVRAGFTLIELMVVMIAIGLIASVVIPQFTTATQDAMAGNLKSQLRSLQNQIEMFAARNAGASPFSLTVANWGSLKAAGFIKTDPVNPAFTAGDKTGVSVATVAGTRGSTTTAWVWNNAESTIYASNFNESTGLVTPNPID